MSIYNNRGLLPWSNEKFISELINSRGTKYDYSLVEYVNAKTKIKIICPNHGIFEQEAHSHKTGTDCPACAQKEVNSKKTMSLDYFLELAQLKFPHFDYSLVRETYKNAKTKIRVICPKHGIFETEPYILTRRAKHGCPQCGWESIGTKLSITWDDFVSRAAKIHRGKYAYPFITQNKEINTFD